MHIRSEPDGIQKLAQIGDSNRFERVGDRPQSELRPDLDLAADNSVTVPVMESGLRAASQAGIKDCISHVSTPKGKKPILKGMVTTACEKNCFYCPFRAGRGRMPRVSFGPDELAETFVQLERAKIVDGIFLSSGIIKGGMTTQDKVIDTVEVLRYKYQYQGYIHLKIMPGAEYDQLYRAMQIADRVSINLEAPTPERLQALAPQKEFGGELLERLNWARQIKQQQRVRASVVTQFVVGAVGDTDLELLGLSEKLYRQNGLARAYYSGFNPIIDTPLENLEPTPAIREFRLYQASFLLRDYGWDVEELPFEGIGNLRLDVDPKLAWADVNLRHDPVDLMQADLRVLMRVPGIGPKGAKAIIKARREGKLSDLSHLRAIGIRATNRAAPYILLDGHRQPHQLSLF